MQDAQDYNCRRFDAMDENLRRAGYREFPCARNTTAPSALGIVGKPASRGHDGITDGDCRARIVLRNIVDMRFEIALGLRQPLDLHAVFSAACLRSCPRLRSRLAWTFSCASRVT